MRSRTVTWRHQLAGLPTFRGGLIFVQQPASRLAYIVSRFPKLWETFIVREMDQLVDLGWEINLFTSHRPRECPVHDEARAWMPRFHGPAGIRCLFLAQLWWLR